VEFEIVTDHVSLTYLKNLRSGPSKLTRASVQLSQFRFKVTHLAGKKNTAADALSRTTELQTGPLTAIEADRCLNDDTLELQLDPTTEADYTKTTYRDVGIQCDAYGINCVATNWPGACADLDWEQDEAATATQPQPQRRRRERASRRGDGQTNERICDGSAAAGVQVDEQTGRWAGRSSSGRPEGGNIKATAGRAGPARKRSGAPATRSGIADNSTRLPRTPPSRRAADCGAPTGANRGHQAITHAGLARKHGAAEQPISETADHAEWHNNPPSAETSDNHENASTPRYSNTQNCFNANPTTVVLGSARD